MGIKKIALFFIAFSFLGCSNKSEIYVDVCNHSGIDKRNIILNWKKGEKKFTKIQNGTCKKTKLTNLLGESQLNLIINRQKHPIDVYFEPYNYQGTIYINLMDKDKIKVISNLNLK